LYSLSSSAPHLFGDQLGGFDQELRQLLADASDWRAVKRRDALDRL
jgi:hypothetical protein